MRKCARGGEREREERLAVAIPDENSGRVFSLSLSFSRSLGVLWPRFARRYFTLSSRGSEARRGGRAGSGWSARGRRERGAGGHVRSRTFRVAGNIVGGDRRNADETRLLSTTGSRDRASAVRSTGHGTCQARSRILGTTFDGLCLLSVLRLSSLRSSRSR